MQTRAKPKPGGHVTRWPKIFVKERNIFDRKFFKSQNALLGESSEDLIDAAFELFESTIPSWGLNVIRRFCKAAEQLTFSSHRKSARAILDDRDYQTGQTRSHAKWLDARSLYQALSTERFQSSERLEMNADRRLIYIYGLSPDYIVTLAKTASYHQMPVLRDTICKHVDAQTSIGIHIPADGLKTFQLEFHIPFPTLRCVHATFSDGDGIDAKLWHDVNFLGMSCEEEDGACSWVLYEANVSVVVWGWDHYRWVGWAFSNTLDDPTCRDEEESGWVDHFATDGNALDDGRILDANEPIWDPREYWLRIVNFRMRFIYQEWSWVVMNVARRIESWVCEQESTLTQKSKSHEAQQQTIGWLTKTMCLLRRLDERLSTTLHKWEVFSAPGGHIEYLSETVDGNVTPMLNTLREKFEKFEQLTDLQAKLKSLENRIGRVERTFALCMVSENSRMVAESHRFNRETHQLCREMVGMNLDVRHFICESSRLSHELAGISRDVCHSNQETSQLCHEMVGVSRDVQRLNRETFQLSHEMVGISGDLRQFNHQSTRAAVDTDRTTRTNLHLFVITTPFVLALQYFGADKDIFSFERNAKTFGIAICVVFCILSTLTCFLSIVNHGWHGLRRKLRPWNEGTRN